MGHKTDAELQAYYRDVVDDDSGDSLVGVLRDLDAGYKSFQLPTALPPPFCLTVVEPTSAKSRGGRKWRVPLPFVAAASILLATGMVFAAASILNLGQQSNSMPVPPSLPLGGFRHTGPFLRQHGKPEILFLGTVVDGQSAAERWAMVKSLSQFGTFSGVTASQTRSCSLTQSGSHQIHTCRPAGDFQGYPTGFPTYDLEHAKFASRYVVLVSKEAIDSNLVVAQNFTPVETALFKRYVKNESGLTTGTPSWPDIVWNTALNRYSVRSDGNSFPLISIGGYLQTSYGALLEGDLMTATGYLPSFKTIQTSLRVGHPVNDPIARLGRTSATLISDVNAESNVITALVCHADGQQPNKVCNRPVIVKLSRYVK
jgi:hypothetical protein